MSRPSDWRTTAAWPAHWACRSRALRHLDAVGEFRVCRKCAPPRPKQCWPPAARAAAIRSPKAPAARRGVWSTFWTRHPLSTTVEFVGGGLMQASPEGPARTYSSVRPASCCKRLMRWRISFVLRSTRGRVRAAPFCRSPSRLRRRL